jgi:UDP-glucose 4-epimerase
VAARRVLITGVSNVLGARLARVLVDDPDVARVVGLDTRIPERDLAERITFIESDVRAPDLAAVLRAAEVDTIVHNDILQFPEPDRTARNLHDINVIGTLQLLAAAETLPSLRQVIVRSSAAIYGSQGAAPAFYGEELTSDGWPGANRTRFQRDVAEIERLVDAFARKRRDVTCTTLRLQPIVGPSIGSPMNALFRGPFVVTALGFDPRLQVLHQDDAVGALVAAVHTPVRGAVNVAGDGVVSLSRALRRLGRRALPVATPLLGPVAGTLARVRGGRPPNEDILRYLRHGRAVDTTRMREELRFRPNYTTLQAIDAVVLGAPA